MVFSDRLKMLRISSGFTQKTVADAIAMATVAYQRYEYGAREPAYNNLVALADFFDVPLDFLAGRPPFDKWELVQSHLPVVAAFMAKVTERSIEEITSLSTSQFVRLFGAIFARVESGPEPNSISMYPVLEKNLSGTPLFPNA